MKVGIYIGGTPRSTIDATNVISEGNPGIGGTEYEFIMLATYLSTIRKCPDDMDITVFQAGRYSLSDCVRSINGISPNQMIEECRARHIDILIVDSRWNLDLLKKFNETTTKLIVWCHCVGSYYRHFLFARWSAVKCVVYVSRGHFLNFMDNPVFPKSTWAFNSVSVPSRVKSLRECFPFAERPHDVVYMGALDESKGFHVLAKAWPEVLAKVPDARLHVIGSANLYGGAFRLGPLGLADQAYEATFHKHLVTKQNTLHPSVILHGKLASEKYDVMARCRVGVPNPCGKTETFCISAVEMQLCGCKVVTCYSSGYIDTVPSPNILVYDESQLADAIVSGLIEDGFNWESNIENIMANFSIESVGQKWMKIIDNVDKNSRMMDTYEIPIQFHARKQRSRLRKFIPIIPPVGFITDTFSRFKAVTKRLLSR